MIRENIEVSEEILAFGGFGEVREGTYKGDRVAVKTTRVPLVGDLTKIRKVSIDDNLGLLLAPSQPFCSSDFTGRLSSGACYPIRTS